MSDDWVPVAIFAVFILFIVAVVITLIVVFLTEHPFIAGFLVGLAAGIGGTLIFLRVRNHLRTHEWVEKPPPE